MDKPLELQSVLYGATGTTYELGRILGNGGMGLVYLAQQRHNDARQAAAEQLVALKLLRQGAPPQARRLFYHEGSLLPRLQHPNIVPFIERGCGAIPGVGTLDYLALGYVAGETLQALLRQVQSPLHPTVVLGVVAQLAAALDYLHQRGVVHCDLKPSNVMIERAQPHAVLIDFGIARAPDFVGPPIGVGTSHYMAPEQIDPRTRCDGRADLYALGVIIFELLTGRRLFHERTITDIREGRQLSPPVAALAPALPAPLVAVIAHCLQASPADRYASASDLLDALREASAQLLQPLPEAPVPLAGLGA